ncbi:hypothetical protein FH608_002325 [Nonomuraea phyllanthi]|uniref:Uncharacterized protein n=1 Tax=Nonomuraea phyllanthi TaxID=2219224 RepID=A0A5C4WX39_9ACTN|nr:hypothetical protein [Nonomuraea phyllanthi]KAB8197415.1 hypothetical protein FH608_002325 [Nonomuraea phyllanthi]QFY06592.1 hypothetical protein GBF35_07745 [Nonomuraea phyllanthi]
MSTETERKTRRVGRWLLCFAVAGGAVAWAVHLLAAWGVVELVCSIGRRDVNGLPLHAFVIVATAVPAVPAAAALAAAWRIWQHDLAGATGRRERRARFLAELGLGLDALACLMIVFGAVALGVIAPCA